MPVVIRTSPAVGVPGFDHLVNRLTATISQWGFRERRQTGSVSWITRSGARYSTAFKLIHTSTGGDVFGTNKSIVMKNLQLRDLSWPVEFAVAPQSKVVFAGFRVGDHEAAVERVKRILHLFPKPDRVFASPVEHAEAERVFDDQLLSLVAGSVAAATAALPNKDFSDWEA